MGEEPDRTQATLMQQALYNSEISITEMVSTLGGDIKEFMVTPQGGDPLNCLSVTPKCLLQSNTLGPLHSMVSTKQANSVCWG
jgi:hypothetical protein